MLSSAPFPYTFILGSSASLRLSPIKLKAVTVRKIANPGKIASHQAPLERRASKRREPQVGTSTLTPTPMKEREDSRRMALAIPNEIATNTGAIAFGNACLKMILKSEKPIDSATWM